jgi:hypothetical protein
MFYTRPLLNIDNELYFIYRQVNGSLLAHVEDGVANNSASERVTGQHLETIIRKRTTKHPHKYQRTPTKCLGDLDDFTLKNVKKKKGKSLPVTGRGGP